MFYMGVRRCFVVVILLLISSLSVFASTNDVEHHWSFDNTWEDTITGTILLRGSGTLNSSENAHFSSVAKVGTAASTFDGNQSTSSTQTEMLHNAPAPYTNGSTSVSDPLENLPSSSSFTFTAWLNFTGSDASDQGTILHYYNDTNSYIRWYYDRKGLADAATLVLTMKNSSTTNTGTWNTTTAGLTRRVYQHVAVVFSGDTPTFYINGVLQTAANESGNLSCPSCRPAKEYYSLLVAGARANSLSGIEGKLDELAIWHKALSASDISALYAAGAGLAYPYAEASDINFTVEYNSTENLAVTTKITTEENSSGLTYNYALACDLQIETLWNELFNNFYNFSTTNLTPNFPSPQTYLTFNGIEWANVIGVTQNFDILEEANQAYRDYLEFNLRYQTNGNHSGDLIFYDETNNPTLWLVLNKTNNALTVNQFFPAYGITNNLANFTLVGGNVILRLVFTPTVSAGTGEEYFSFTITESNNTGTQVSTSHSTNPDFGGMNIKNVELFVGNRFNGTTYYKAMSLARTNNPNPDYVLFQNGEREVIDGVTFEVPSIDGITAGDGFTLVPDYNNVWYSVCQYEDTEPKTQRHFIAPVNQGSNWDNYVDLVITPSQIQENTSEDTEGGLAGAGSGDFATDIIPGLLCNTVVKFCSTGSKLLAWFVISIICGVIIALLLIHIPQAAVLLGSLTFIGIFVTGAFTGMVPVIFMLLFILVCAALITALLGYIFGG